VRELEARAGIESALPSSINFGHQSNVVYPVLTPASIIPASICVPLPKITP
jgi:hypothetical protein